MKVYKNHNMPVWCPHTGTHYSQMVTLGENEQEKFGLHFSIGLNYCHLGILNCFPGEVFKKYKMMYDNTCIKIVKEK